MHQIRYKTSRRIKILVKEKIIEEHKSNGDGAQWKTKIIRSSFIQAVSNTSLTLKNKLSGATLWDDAVSNTLLMQQNKQNKWMNVLQYIYKQNDWTPAQQKVFTSEICHCVDAFDYDLLEGTLSFIDMDVPYTDHIVSSDVCCDENNCNDADEQQFYVVSASGEPVRNGWGIY